MDRDRWSEILVKAQDSVVGCGVTNNNEPFQNCPVPLIKFSWANLSVDVMELVRLYLVFSKIVGSIGLRKKFSYKELLVEEFDRHVKEGPPSGIF